MTFVMMKKPRVSRSGRTFSSRGVKQTIKKGCILRSAGYGSRIVVVLGKWGSWWVLAHHCNTSWFDKPHDRDNEWFQWDAKGRTHPRGQGHPFLGHGHGWQVVKEITK